MASTKQKRLKRLKRLLEARKQRRHKEDPTADLPPAVPESSEASAIPMAEVIEYVAKPIFDELGRTSKDLEVIVGFAIVAWNLTLRPIERRAQESQELLERMYKGKSEVDPEMEVFFHWICEVVAERKAKYYPNLNRFILKYNIQPDDDGGIYFQVAHTEAPN